MTTLSPYAAKENPKVVLQLVIDGEVIEEQELFMQNQNRDNRKAEVDAVIDSWKSDYNLTMNFFGWEVYMLIQSSMNDYTPGQYKRELIETLSED